MTPELWVQIAGVVVVCATAIIGFWKWLVEQRKRYDPLAQEIHRRRVDAYCRIAAAMAAVHTAALVANRDNEEWKSLFLDKFEVFAAAFSQELLLMEDEVHKHVWRFQGTALALCERENERSKPVDLANELSGLWRDSIHAMRQHLALEALTEDIARLAT